MMLDPSGPMLVNRDDEHLRLLSIFHYVVAGFAAFFGCFPLIHVGMGIAIISGAFPSNPHATPPPPFFGWFFVLLGGFFIVAGWTFAVLLYFAGKRLGQRTHRTFCLVIAALSTLFAPFGTALGVCTLIVLSRPTVKAAFEQRPLPA